MDAFAVEGFFFAALFFDPVALFGAALFLAARFFAVDVAAAALVFLAELVVVAFFAGERFWAFAPSAARFALDAPRFAADETCCATFGALSEIALPIFGAFFDT